MRVSVSGSLLLFGLIFSLAAHSGDVKGKVTFEGTAPPEQPIRMTGDPKCEMIHKGDPLMTTNFVVGPDKGLQWVFVYLKEGVNGEFPPPKEPVVLDQVGCHYVPHVFGIQVGQPLTLRNSDPLLHNVHIIPKENKEANIGMPLVGDLPHVFDKPEVMITIKCDIHNWMYAFAGVLPHPFFATTGPDGAFEIKNVPAGDYKIAFWHRRMAEQVLDIKVGEGALEQNVTFTESMIKGRKKKN